MKNLKYIILTISIILLVVYTFDNKQSPKDINITNETNFGNISVIDKYIKKDANKKELNTLIKELKNNDKKNKNYLETYLKLKINYYKTKNANLKDSRNVSILMYAIHEKNKDLITELIINGANLNLIANNGFTALSFAAINNDLETIKLLINNGADINLKGSQTPILFSASNSDLKVLEYLINNGANIESKNIIDGKTPLLMAFANSNIETVNYLIDKGANLHAIDKDDYGITMMAALSGDLKKIQLIENSLDNLQVEDKYKNNILMVSSYYGNKNTIDYLINDINIDVNAKNKYGNTALLDAARHLNTEGLMALLKNGTDVNAKTNIVNSTVLSDFISLRANNHFDKKEANIAQNLINNGALINEQNNNGRSPLHVAVIVKKANLVEVLLKNKVNINLRDKFGNTALDIAKINKDYKIIELFNKY